MIEYGSYVAALVAVGVVFVDELGRWRERRYEREQARRRGLVGVYR